MPHPELALEQSHLDHARKALRAMAERTTASLADAGSAATEADSEVARWHLRRRLESLTERDDLVAFGRIDDGADRWYVGRRHIEDTAGEPLVVDWRAPVSIPFYRATVHDPLGLDGRRRFTGDGPTLLDILEEDFNDPDGALVSGGIPDPLLAELERARTGAMRDIVATIAAEQDEVIRAPLHRLLVVQGGPGTGKTAVALHRAAYLLFEHRTELLDSGVLVVGPNPVFLRYVADVLPSLGETAVRQTTVDGLRAGGLRVAEAAPGVHLEPDEVSALKGDPRMAAVIAAAIRDTVRLPEATVAISTTWGRVILRPEDVAAAADEVLGRGVTHATGREGLRNLLLHRAYELHERSAETPALKANFTAAARAHPEFRKFLDRTWPLPAPTTVVARILGNAAARRRATNGILTPREAASLARRTAPKAADERWLPSEVPLLDEADAQLNGVRVTYGHVVADEAQDLSTMALRMLARRARDGSITLVGDLAQATRPGAQSSWDEVVALLQGPAPAQRSELTVGYRTPAPILDLANRLLPVAAPEVTPARSIRQTGEPPVFVRAAAAELPATVAAQVAATRDQRGTAAVVAVAERHESLAEALDEAGVAWGRGAAGLAGVALLTPLAVKGLEFDAVVVVEPAEVVADEPAGHRALFVALSRPTRTLIVVHAEDLPPELT